jgi:hypothetical protein
MVITKICGKDVSVLARVKILYALRYLGLIKSLSNGLMKRQLITKLILRDFIAHTIQHEVDHLNGVLFVDRVEDTKTYMLVDEFKKYVSSE